MKSLNQTCLFITEYAHYQTKTTSHVELTAINSK